MRLYFLLPLLSTLGCFAVSPGTPPGNHPNPDMGPTAGQDQGPPPPPSFAVAATPQRTYWMTVPVSGTGPANGMVIIQSTAGGAQTAPIGPDHQFCTDVPLKANSDNTIMLRPQDSTGMLGAPVTVVVTQSGSPPPAPTGQPAANASLYNIVDHSGNSFCGLSGDSSLVDDGDPTTYFGITPCYGHDAMVTVHFGSEQIIEKAVLKFDSGALPESFDVYLSNSDVPAACADNTPDWQKVGHSDTAAAVNTVPFAATNSQHICVIGHHSYSWGILTVEQRFAEIEAWTQAFVAPPPPHAPTCGGTGL